MKVVLDTNVLLISIPTQSTYRPIFTALINAEFDLIITNDILLEYTEVIERKTNASIATNIAEMLLSLHNLTKLKTTMNGN